ncbi:hypothetical protein DFH08DRAFT_942345 [Mycena albidolilacea]|uniref:Uncharacterized protein n=1 Tax=Mycena albidolilacea TaxID=1033008 RepID=A0AAD7EFF2_9AGAR|nr:hypothetical protein DFH08DRAFT_942345 [Mycena albidolilacea]
MRRNSLDDLKIPARISQAQVGLRRDLGMLREFTRNVEGRKLRRRFFERHRTNTSTSGSSPTVQQQTQQQAYKQLASAFYPINSKYRISWECAELLIELGGGGTSSPPSTSTSAPAMQQSAVGESDGLKGAKKSKRERAITLQEDAKAPPAPGPVAATASLGTTGRNDLSTRQLLLLKKMLNPTPGGPDESFVEDIPEEMVAAMAAGSTATVNREWRWGDAMNSTVTLPSEESGTQGDVPGKETKRRSSRMRMSGIRDMLRALTKGGATPPVPVSSTSVSTASSSDLHAQHLYQHRQVATNGKQQRWRAKTSAGLEPVSIRSTHRPLSPFDPPSLKTASPRSASTSTGDEEEDWDRLEDSASDAETAAAVARRGGSTIRGRSPYMQTLLLTPASGRPTTPMRSPSGSRTSVHDLSAAAPARATRLSNVEEHADTKSTSKAESPSRQFSRSRRGGKTGSVRSMPPATLPDPKLSMTPENIKPLLENAREVHARLSDCIAEIRTLLAARP